MLHFNKKFLLYGSEKYSVAILKAFQKVAEEKGAQVAWFFDGPGAELLNEADVLLNRIPEVEAFNPCAVLAPGDWVPHFFPGLKVEVFHGFDAGKPKHLHVRGLFDLYCTQGPNMTQAWQELAKKHQHFAVRETGWMKMDPFFSQELRAAHRFQNKKPTVLFHSTFSPRWSAALHLFDQLKQLINKNDKNWIISFHPKMNEEVVRRYKALASESVIFSTEDNIHKLQISADLVLSDTSSALVEALVIGKPVLTFRNRKPHSFLHNITEVEELEGAIARILTLKKNTHDLELFRNEIHPYTDGNSALRVYETIQNFIENKEYLQLKKKPLNFFRKLKIRKRLRKFL